MDVWDFALATLHGLDFVGQFAQWILATRRSPAMYALDSCILDSHCQSYFHVETFEHMFVTVPDDAEPLLKSFFGNSALVKKLKQQDHNALVEHLCCPPAYGNPKALAKMPRVDLMHSLVDYIGGDDVEWIKAVKEMLQRPSPRKT